MNKLEELALWQGGPAIEMAGDEIKKQRLNRIDATLDTLQEINTLLQSIKVASVNLENANGELTKFRNKLRREAREIHALLDSET